MGILKRLFGKKAQEQSQPIEPEKNPKFIADDLAKVIDAKELDKTKVFPVVRSTSDPRVLMSEKMGQPVLKHQIAEDLIITYSLDLGEQLVLIDEQRTASWEIAPKEMLKMAMQNLGPMINNHLGTKTVMMASEDEAHAVYQVSFDPNYDNALMIFKEVWKALESQLSFGKIAVGIPAKNIVFCADASIQQSLSNLRSATQTLFDASVEDDLAVSNAVYEISEKSWSKIAM